MKRICAVVVLGLAALPAFAVNFSGKWAIQPAAGGRGGRGGPIILVLNHVGDEVTGSISARVDAGTASPVNTEVLGGKVEGDVLSFYVWSGTDQPAKTTYRGTMSATGDEIQFTVTGGRGNPGMGMGGGQPGGRGGNGQGASGATPGAGASRNGGGAQGASQQVTAKRAK